ncbi:MAG: hypothetical protein DMD41_14395 [Gemmatimonadetes bacterium]|nr:MAG: hypothetical protein DMD41_14395 [Gemmatimonadota bacterium]
MRVARLGRVALVLTAAALLSCGEPPLSPVPPPQASLIGGLLQATGLLQCTAMPTATATQTVGPAGGVINVGPHRLSIPAGALGAPVTITATAPSDNVNRIQFQPEGLVFQRSAALTMSYANCSLLGKLLPKQIAYTDDALNILSYLWSLDDLFAKKVTGKLNHFSNYAVAW